MFIGDDLNDEPALALVRRLGGLAVVVGRRPSRAEYRLGDPAEVARFLGWLEKRWRARVEGRDRGRPSPGPSRPKT